MCSSDTKPPPVPTVEADEVIPPQHFRVGQRLALKLLVYIDGKRVDHLGQIFSAEVPGQNPMEAIRTEASLLVDRIVRVYGNSRDEVQLYVEPVVTLRHERVELKVK